MTLATFQKRTYPDGSVYVGAVSAISRIDTRAYTRCDPVFAVLARAEQGPWYVVGDEMHSVWSVVRGEFDKALQLVDTQEALCVALACVTHGRKDDKGLEVGGHVVDFHQAASDDPFAHSPPGWAGGIHQLFEAVAPLLAPHPSI